MIPIKKGKEPRELTQLRCSYSPEEQTWELVDGKLKEIIRKHLLEEQGHLCAYCMRPITAENMTIEHWHARNPKDGPPQKGKNWDKLSIAARQKELKRFQNERRLTLDYANMLGVCSVTRNAQYSDQTCDAHRGNSPLTVNPLKESTLQTIEYKHDGSIDSCDPEIKNDLVNILNLNSKPLKEFRKNTLYDFLQLLSKKYPNRRIPKEVLIRYRQNLENKNPKNGFVGIILWWLDKEIKSKSR